MKRRAEMNFWERIYLPEIIRGLFVTAGKLTEHFFLHLLHVFGLKSGVPAAATIQYPDERRLYPARFRGRHRLTLHADGRVKCTSCFLCATACPARCIYIEAAEHVDPYIEKFPRRFEIDTLLCIYCGYCVEACPVDAIRMDSGIHPVIHPPDRRLFIEDKELLMQRSCELDQVGPQGVFERHMKDMRDLERNPCG